MSAPPCRPPLRRRTSACEPELLCQSPFSGARRAGLGAPPLIARLGSARRPRSGPRAERAVRQARSAGSQRIRTARDSCGSAPSGCAARCSPLPRWCDGVRRAADGVERSWGSRSNGAGRYLHRRTLQSIRSGTIYYSWRLVRMTRSNYCSRRKKLLHNDYIRVYCRSECLPVYFCFVRRSVHCLVNVNRRGGLSRRALLEISHRTSRHSMYQFSTIF
jgi:hypothetical protein